MPRKSRFAAVAAALLATTAASAHGAGTEQLTSSWANVNICNAGQLGARAQLAGDGSKDTMRVRFTAQWLSPDGWVPLAGEATSPWQDAGSAEFTWAQAGWTFNIAVPAGAVPEGAVPEGAVPEGAVPEPAASYQLRAVAEMDLGSGRSATQTTGVCTIGG